MTAPTPCAPASPWTAEQRHAIERREGDMLVSAGAGSGKTSVLVERFVRSVIEDEIDVSAILTITFTEKAAAEMRERIRRGLRDRGAIQAARVSDVAAISTIHAFCARVLRAHALLAGIDPEFRVMDELEAQRLAAEAFDEALGALAQAGPDGVELVAAYGVGTLRGAILATHAQLRSRGQRRPALPALARPPDPGPAREQLRGAAHAVAQELRAIPDPSARVTQALERLERCGAILDQSDPWPGELDAVGLPGGNGAALSTPACQTYAQALISWRSVCAHELALHSHELLDRLLGSFAERYERRKRDVSGVDFEDLELLTRDLLTGEEQVRDGYRRRFARIMVDELQDTNRVQLELIEAIATGNLFMVGDAQQSIYAFRHADVGLFQRRADRLAEVGAHAALTVNFRSRPEILAVVNRAFTQEWGDRFTSLVAGRTDPPAGEPLVELMIVDKAGELYADGLGAPWRQAEARALAGRIAELIAQGARAGEIVLLTRATTDLRVYELALEQRGVPTYVIGGRGYWSHPQVLDLVHYLRALANPREAESLLTVLHSPLVGVSLDTLVLVSAASRSGARDAWAVVRDGDEQLSSCDPADLERLTQFTAWFAVERAAMSRLAADQLIERVLERTGYDLTVLAMRGGRRRMANVRKLMRLAREHEDQHGPDLRGFLDLAASRAGGPDERESEAPVEGETLDAIRLMTIHRAKGLEFPIVCVADLGRAPWRRADLLRIAPDGRFGLRLARAGTGRRVGVLDYEALRLEQIETDGGEERRLFYVAMTRARERLLLSGAAGLDAWSPSGPPMSWIAPALVPDIAERLRTERSGVADGVRFSLLGEGVKPCGRNGAAPPDGEPPGALNQPAPPAALTQPATSWLGASDPSLPPDPSVPTSGHPRLSYSALADYERCGYRFYVERMLRIPPAERRPGPVTGAQLPDPAKRELEASQRGVVVHALLERLDFRHPIAPAASVVAELARHEGFEALGEHEAGRIGSLVQAFAGTELCARLGRATRVRRELPFRFRLQSGLMFTGKLDALAREPGGMLVVDYKSDRLDGAAPGALVAREYSTQQLIYALAVLHAGAERVQVAHLFLESPEAPVMTEFRQERLAALENDLSARAAGVVERRFIVTDVPQRRVCAGCPAEGGLCSWPVEMTRREAPDRLF